MNFTYSPQQDNSFEGQVNYICFYIIIFDAYKLDVPVVLKKKVIRAKKTPV